MPKYIDGIFNYCDAWCERCPFTSRCRNFTMRRAIERRAARRDSENEAFWEAMDKACGDAMAELVRRVDSLGPTDGFDKELDEAEQADCAAFAREEDLRDRELQSHPLARLAERYLRDSHRWLERRRGRIPPEIADAVEVIAWYHMFISVKLSRALGGILEEGEEEDSEDAFGHDDQDGDGDEDEFSSPKDSDGSAKIAIIAVERSFAAWSFVRDRVDREKKNAAKFMATLMPIRALADKTFPNARTFHRPGFDDVGSRD